MQTYKKIVEYREQAAAEKEAIDATSASLAEKIDMLKQAQDAYDDQSSALDTAQSAYETLTSAINEYNKTGVLSIDTFQKIMALSPEYLQMYFNQATAADSATNAIYTQAQALQIAKIQELQAAAANDVYLYSIGKYSEMSPLAQQAIGGVGNSAITTGANVLTAAANFATFTASTLSNVNSLRNAAGYSSLNVGDLTAGMTNIISAYQGIASSIASIDVGSLSNLAGATSSAGGAAHEASNAYDDLVKITMEMLKQQTKDQIELYQKEIEELKKEHDAAVDSLKDQLDKYKDLIDAKKKSLEATKEERKYQEELADKQKSVTQIQQRLDEISLDTSESGIAEKMKLQEELADAQQELDDYQYDHQVAQQEDALDAEESQYEQHINGQIAMLDAYYAHVEETYQNDIDALQTYLDQEGRIRLDAIALIQSGAQSFYNQLSVWNQNYGDMTAQELQTLISNAGTAGSSISSSMGSAANSVGGVGRAAGEAAGKFQELTQQMQEYYRWLNLLNSDTGAHENSAYWSTHGGYPTHHKGLDSGFVGDNKTSGNEMFIKALKGEVFVTPNQQNNFMNKVIPSMISNAGSSITADNLISINVSGNLDSSVVPELKTTIKSSFESLAKTLASRGIVRTANNFQ